MPDHTEAAKTTSYPVAHRLLEKCDAVLRLQGASKGADEDVPVATERGLKIYFDINEVPDHSDKKFG